VSVAAIFPNPRAVEIVAVRVDLPTPLLPVMISSLGEFILTPQR